jgi:hypothetical protein
VANLGELKEQTVEGHPKSVLYKLLIGPRTAARDRINAAYAVADFFLMDFASAGTNFPHPRNRRRNLSRPGWRGTNGRWRGNGRS